MEIAINEVSEILDDKSEVIGLLSQLGIDYSIDQSFTHRELQEKIGEWIEDESIRSG